MIKLGKVKGIPIGLGTDYVWFVGALLVFGAILSGTTTLLTTAVAILTISAVILLHEFGHALTAASFGIKTEKITLHCIGGVASLSEKEYKKSIEKPSRAALIWFAGPCVNLVLYGCTVALLYFMRKTVVVDLPNLFRFLNFFRDLNIILAVFNLLPIFPLDGGGILYSLLSMITSRTTAIRITSMVGMFGACCLIVLAILMKAPLTAFIGVMAFLISKNAPKSKVFHGV